VLQKYEITVVKPCEKRLKYPQFGGKKCELHTNKNREIEYCKTICFLTLK